MSIRLAIAQDSEALCQLLEKSPMGEQIRLTFERRPDYFLGAGIQAEELLVVVGEEEKTGEIFGVFAAGTRRVFVDGEPRSIPYLSDLRLDPSHRGGTWLMRGYRHLRTEVLGTEAFAQTLILSDNAQVRELLTSRRGGLPFYHPCGEYRTHFLSGIRQAKGSSEHEVRQAKPEDAAMMQAFFDQEARTKQFYPCYQFSELGKTGYYRDLNLVNYWLAFNGGELIGILGGWNQSAFRQTRIQGYGGLVGRLRPFINLCSRVQYPPVGSQLPMRYLHTAVTRDNHPAILRSLLGRVLASEPTFTGYWVLGLDQADPLNQAVSGMRKRTFGGLHYLVSFQEKPPTHAGIYYFEAGRI